MSQSLVLIERLDALSSSNDLNAYRFLLEKTGLHAGQFGALWLHKSISQLKQGNLGNALAYAWKYHALQHSDAQVSGLLGHILIKLGQRQLALTFLSGSLRQDPKDVQVQMLYLATIAEERPQSLDKKLYAALPFIRDLNIPRLQNLMEIAGLKKIGAAIRVGQNIHIWGITNERVSLCIRWSNGLQVIDTSLDIDPVQQRWVVDIPWRSDCVAAQVLWSDDNTPLVGGALNNTAIEPTRAPRDYSMVAEPRIPEALQEIDVIIPVYDGDDETRNCLRSVLTARCTQTARIIVVNDASPSRDLQEFLENLKATTGVMVLEHPVNEGFTGAVNHALQHCRGRDVILLNADTVVCDGWIDRIQTAAYSSPDIGLVCPLTNNGQVVSYPSQYATAPLPADLRAFDDAAARKNAGNYVDLLAGIGFCLFIRSDCREEIGDFDALTFGRGYGEDADYCLRARANGWRTVCATDVFVGHEGTVSFRDEKDILVAANRDALAKRYPTFKMETQLFYKDDPLRASREAITRELLGSVFEGYSLVVCDAAPSPSDEALRRFRYEREAAGERLAWIFLDRRMSCGRVVLEIEGVGPAATLQYRLPHDQETLAGDLLRLSLARIHILTKPPVGLGATLTALDLPLALHLLNASSELLDMIGDVDAVHVYSSVAQDQIAMDARDKIVEVKMAPTRVLPDDKCSRNIAVVTGAQTPDTFDTVLSVVRASADQRRDWRFYILQDTVNDAALERAGDAIVLGSVRPEDRQELAHALNCQLALAVGDRNDIVGWRSDAAADVCPRPVVIGSAADAIRLAAHPRAYFLEQGASVEQILHILERAAR